MYPLVFNDVFKDYIWGGRNLERWGKKLPDGITAESWEISCHPDGPSVVNNGEYKGVKLADLVFRFPVEMMGSKMANRYIDFPLLVKLIDAQEKLSVQVHPDDAYARLHENDNGKNEMWYILWAARDAQLILDVKENTNKERFLECLARGNVEEILRTVHVKEGDVIYIPSGLVHAIGSGIVLIEIQQNSNATYRLYDYNRKGKDGKPRPLHIDKALDVIDFQNAGRRRIFRGLTIPGPGLTRKILSASAYFSAEDWYLQTHTVIETKKERFYLFTCLEGEALVKWEEVCVPVRKGMSFMIPALCDRTVIEANKGGCRLIISTVPDIENEIIRPLLDAGYDENVILNEIPGIRL